jgi:cytochrome c-type biogenesis protein
MLYDFFTQISNFLSQPFFNIASNVESIPLLAAFLLGLVGALAPCQFTGNLGAIAIYGNQSVQKGMAWSEIIFFIIGKVIAFTSLGAIVWVLGREIQQEMITYFPWIRKLIGPVLIVVGLYMAGLFAVRWTVKVAKISKSWIKKGRTGAFLLGVSFSLAFCPTMFVLFFITLMPMVVTTPYGLVLPSLFAIGTSLPLIAAIFLIWYFGISGAFMKKGRKIGFYVQRVAGWIIVILGVVDTITYWQL